MIIDAENLIVGRFATVVAKKSLLGEKVDIINCEKAVITGKKVEVLKKYKRKRNMGAPLKGPYFPRMPDRFVRRIIRGMIPYKQPKGKEAFRRIMCYKGIPKQFEGKPAEKVKAADAGKLPNLNYISVAEICRHLGAKE